MILRVFFSLSIHIYRLKGKNTRKRNLIIKEIERSSDIVNLNIFLPNEIMILKMPALRGREGNMVMKRVQNMMIILIPKIGGELIIRMREIIKMIATRVQDMMIILIPKIGVELIIRMRGIIKTIVTRVQDMMIILILKIGGELIIRTREIIKMIVTRVQDMMITLIQKIEGEEMIIRTRRTMTEARNMLQHKRRTISQIESHPKSILMILQRDIMTDQRDREILMLTTKR